LSSYCFANSPVLICGLHSGCKTFFKEQRNLMIIIKSLKILMAALALFVGLYPFRYFFVDRKFGLLQFKTEAVLTSPFWNVGFYSHIVPGGIALLIGWIQFNKKLRTKRLTWHRAI